MQTSTSVLHDRALGPHQPHSTDSRTLDESVSQCCAAGEGPEHDDAVGTNSIPQACTAERLQHHSRQSTDAFHDQLADRGRTVNLP